MERISTVLRVHFTDTKSVVVVPIIILIAAFAVSIGIGVIAQMMGISDAGLRDLNDGMKYNGAVWAMLGMGMGVGFATMGAHLSFALGMGITRREWVLGSALVFAIVAGAVTAVITIGKVIEVATGGWGLSIRMFDTAHTGMGPWWQTLVQTFLILITGMTVSAMIGSIWHRWRKIGVMVLAAGVILFGLLVTAWFMLAPASQTGAVLEAVFGMAWGGWMVVLAVIAVIAGLVWSVLTRRTEVR